MMKKLDRLYESMKEGRLTLEGKRIYALMNDINWSFGRMAGAEMIADDRAKRVTINIGDRGGSTIQETEIRLGELNDFVKKSKEIQKKFDDIKWKTYIK